MTNFSPSLTLKSVNVKHKSKIFEKATECRLCNRWVKFVWNFFFALNPNLSLTNLKVTQILQQNFHRILNLESSIDLDKSKFIIMTV